MGELPTTSALFGPLAQLAEQEILNLQVPGSIPGRPIVCPTRTYSQAVGLRSPLSSVRVRLSPFHGEIAQLEEHGSKTQYPSSGQTTLFARLDLAPREHR